MIAEVATRDDLVREAGELTLQIKQAAENLWELLLRAYERRVWQTLGYPSWAAYIETEFDMHLSRSYQLLDAGRVVRALQEATGLHPFSTVVETMTGPDSPAALSPATNGAAPLRPRITERQARRIKPRLKDVVTDVRYRLLRGQPPQDAVEQAIAERGGKVPNKKQSVDLALLLDQHDMQLVAQKYRGLQTLAETARLAPAEIVRAMRQDERRRYAPDEVREAIAAARAWLDDFEREWNGAAGVVPRSGGG